MIRELKKLSLTYNGKFENLHLLLCHCRYFNNTFTEMFLELYSTNHMNFMQTAQNSIWLVAMLNRMEKSLYNYETDTAETVQKGS